MEVYVWYMKNMSGDKALAIRVFHAGQVVSYSKAFDPGEFGENLSVNIAEVSLMIASGRPDFDAVEVYNAAMKHVKTETIARPKERDFVGETYNSNSIADAMTLSFEVEYFNRYVLVERRPPKTVEELADEIPGIDQIIERCPRFGEIYYFMNRETKCEQEGFELKYTIIHLNDHHKLTREEIADWIETLDNVPGWY